MLLPLRVAVEVGEEGGDKPKQSQLIPSAVSLRIAETEQLYHAQRMFGGIVNVLLSTCSQTENGEDPRVSFGEPLEHVITLRVQILVCRTGDDLLPPRVYVQNALRV